MRTTTLLLTLALSALSIQAQNDKPNEISNIPTVTFCDLIHNPETFHDREVRFRATYLASSKVASFVDKNCLLKGKQTWAEFDGIAIKDSTPPELNEKLDKQILCGKCGDKNNWRETEVFVTGIFNGDDQGHGWLGKYRFNVTVKKIEEMSDTVETDRNRFVVR